MAMQTNDTLTEMTSTTINGGEMILEIDEALRRIVRDVIDRELLRGPRTVTVKIAVSPEVDSESRRNYPRIEYSIATAIPGRKGPATTAIVDRDGKLLVNIIEQNARQGTLDFDNVPVAHEDESAA